MSIICTRCDGTGFLNLHQIEDDLQIKINAEGLNHDEVLKWIDRAKDHDVRVCDCCGNGFEWYGEPGQHYTSHDRPGEYGPYDYNGGLCECH